MTAFTVTAEDLHAALANLQPHTGADDTHPVLTCMQVAVEADRVTFATTDRYSLAIYEISAVGIGTIPGVFLLPLAAAKDTVKATKAAPPATPVTVTVEPDGKLTVATPSTSASYHAGVGEYPKYQALIPDGQPAEAPLDFGMSALNFTKLAKPLAGQKPVKGATWRFVGTAPRKPFLALPAWTERPGHSLRVLLMPVRIDAPVGAAA